MKLRELKEDARDDMIAKRAMDDFVDNIVTQLGKVADKSAIANPVTQQAPTNTAGSSAFGNMASQLSGNKPNTMANAPVSRTNTAQPGNPNQQTQSTPAQTRQQKQATAAKAAQAGMTNKQPSVDDVINPKYTPGPMPDGFTQINLFRPGAEPQIRYVHKSHLQSWLQNGWKQGPGDGSATWTDQAAQTRQQKQAAAAQAAQAGMTPKPVTKPAVWRSGRNPGAPATTRENKAFEKLNNIFESILNVDEASQWPGGTNTWASQQSQPSNVPSISDAVSQYFIQLMKSPIFKTPELEEKIKEFAKEVEQTYPTDKGRAALQEMGEWAWQVFQQSKQPNRSTSLGGSSQQPVSSNVPPTAPAAGPTINSDGSITISGAKGQAPAKIMPGDPMYKQLAAAINNQLSK